ncbi:hypothetical protein BJ508DRAFT_312648 [Ascobolus immersus RN42]|uniref:Uncharacterized protein n=1 Tax=Ascobolus immersus RN42 TaxID=1160509 RepID=A0A3N4HN36_ASCIM|nr:hypothetical protein BJ508DRAFT_312648 [Ascobolus immersus RN42]
MSSGYTLPVPLDDNTSRASTTESDKNIDPILRALQATTMNQTVKREEDDEMRDQGPGHGTVGAQPQSGQMHRDVSQSELKEEPSDGESGLRDAAATGELDNKGHDSDGKQPLNLRRRHKRLRCNGGYFAHRWRSSQTCDLCKGPIPKFETHAHCVNDDCTYKECKACVTRRLRVPSPAGAQVDALIEDPNFQREFEEASKAPSWTHDWYLQE